MIVTDPTLKEIERRFHEWCGSNNFRIDDPVSLIGVDNSLLFTNSTMVRYKESMLAGLPVKWVAQDQPCFRERVPPGHPHWFRMIGFIIDGANFGLGVKLACSLLEALVGDRGMISALIGEADDDWAHAWVEQSGAPFYSMIRVPSQMEVTRWRYGSNTLEGRGITLGWRRAGAFWDATDGRVVGTLVLIENGRGTSYVEFAVGLERILGVVIGEDPYLCSRQKRIVETLCGRLVSQSDGLESLHRIVAIEKLDEAGCRPSGRGMGHVLTRLIRCFSEDDWIDLFKAGLIGSDLTDRMTVFLRARADRRFKNRSLLEKSKARGRSIDAYSTFGICMPAIAERGRKERL